MHAVAIAWSLGSALAITLMRVVVIAAPPPKAQKPRPIMIPQEEEITSPEQRKMMILPNMLDMKHAIVNQ